MNGSSPRSTAMADETASKHCPIKNPIREQRKRVGLSTVELARLLDVSPARIVQFESGHKPPDDRLEALARALSVGVDQLRSEFTNYWGSLYDSAVEKVGYRYRGFGEQRCER